MRKTKGITLVALVITIIVLLILAGITISLTIGQNGIITRAQEAGRNYLEAQNRELAGLNAFDEQVGNIVDSLDQDSLARKAKPGDYVVYTPVNKNFTVLASKSGADADQNFSTSTYTGLWQVLYNDSAHGLQIMSDDNVIELSLGNDTDLEKAKLGYNNGVDILNEISQSYLNATYAYSARSIGSNPYSPQDTTTQTYTLPFAVNGVTQIAWKVADENYLEDDTQISRLEEQYGSSYGDIYWMASREVSSYADDYVNFNLYFNDLRITRAGRPTIGAFYNNKSDAPYAESNQITYGVKPVITIKSSVKTTAGDGSLQAPFILE